MIVEDDTLTRSFYEPARGIIFLRANASPYTRFHELAHKAQHEKQTVVFYVWKALVHVRLLGYLATLWIELDADRRARRAMKKAGLWNKGAQREARRNTMSYIFRREIQWQ